MARILDRREANVGVAYHSVVLCDDHSDESLWGRSGLGWLTVGESTILVTPRQDVGIALFYLEAWDGEPPLPNASEWPSVETVTLTLPTGRMNVRQMAQGQINNVLDAGGPGVYRVRLAWRETAEQDWVDGEPEAFLLAQFWPASTTLTRSPD